MESFGSAALFRTAPAVPDGGGALARSNAQLIFPTEHLSVESYHPLDHSVSRNYNCLCRHSCFLFQIEVQGRYPRSDSSKGVERGASTPQTDQDREEISSRTRNNILPELSMPIRANSAF
jgi:hypothetical protein